MINNTILQEIYNRFDAKTIKNEIFDKNLSGYGEYNTDKLEYFRDYLQAIIYKEYKNPSSEWYYPFDIKLFVDQLDKGYITIVNPYATDIKTKLKNEEYVCGETYFPVLDVNVKRNFICIFVRQTILLAIKHFNELYNYYMSDITPDMILDYFRAVINHEIYHYRQYEYCITHYGKEFTLYMYDRNFAINKYSNRDFEIEATKVTVNYLLKYSIYLPKNNQQYQNLMPFEEFFRPFLEKFNNIASTDTLSKNFYNIIYRKVSQYIDKHDTITKFDIEEYIQELLHDRRSIYNSMKYHKYLYNNINKREDINNIIINSIYNTTRRVYMCIHWYDTKDDLGYLKELCGFIGTNLEFILHTNTSMKNN